MVAVLALLAVLAIPSAVPQPEHLDQLATKLQHSFSASPPPLPACRDPVVDIGSGKRFGVNEDLLFPQGSAIKIPILIELYRRADRGEVSLPIGCGRPRRPGGRQRSASVFRRRRIRNVLHDLAVAMIVLSDNSATNILIERLGMDWVSQTMAELGAKQTRLRRKMIRPEESEGEREPLDAPRGRGPHGPPLTVRAARLGCLVRGDPNHPGDSEIRPVSRRHPRIGVSGMEAWRDRRGADRLGMANLPGAARSPS